MNPGTRSGAARSRLGRDSVPDIAGAAALAVALGAALVLAFQQGGYFLADRGVVEMVLLVALALATMLAPGIGGAWGLTALGGWAGLAIWQGLSMAWASDPSAARDAMGLTLLYAAALGLGLVGLRRRSWLPRVSEAVLLVATIVCATAVTARLAPGSIGDDAEARLSWPIGYWNGLGALAAAGIVLAIGIAGASARPLAIRAAASGLVPLFALTMLFTLSRGALLVAIIGLVVLFALAPGRVETLAVAAVTLAISTPLAVHVNGLETLVDLSGELPPHADDGRRVGLLLLGAVIACALAGGAAAWASARTPRVGRIAVVAGAWGALALTALVALIAAPPPGGAVGWADDQFADFRSFSPGARGESASISDRLAVAAGSGRWQQWEVAGAQFEEAPLAGTGAGDFRFEWTEERPIEQAVVNAHSLYLEVLAESGVIGLVLLLVPIGAGIGAGVLAARRAPPWLGRELALAGVAFLTMALHMGGDWDWQLPGVVLPVVVLGGAAIKAASLGDGDAAEAPGAGPLSRLAVAAVALIAVLAVASPTLSARAQDDARAAAREGDLQRALADAGTAVDRDPASPSARLLEANVLSDLGRDAQADVAYRDALARSPRDWTILADWAASLAARGETEAAAVRIERAVELNPLEPRLEALAEVVEGP